MVLRLNLKILRSSHVRLSWDTTYLQRVAVNVFTDENESSVNNCQSYSFSLSTLMPIQSAFSRMSSRSETIFQSKFISHII